MNTTDLDPRTRPVKIGYLVKQPEEPWFQYEWRGADRAAARYGFQLVKLGVPDGEKVIATFAFTADEQMLPEGTNLQVVEEIE